MDEFIRYVKGRSALDGFLEWLHLLMLMDDTVLFATSRKRLWEKLNLLVVVRQKWNDHNEDKAEFMAFYSRDVAKQPITSP